VSDTSFWTALFSIIVIDIALAGDNAVVIALAARRLPKEKRRKAIVWGALAAIVVRVALTAFVAQLLTVQFVKLVGGLVILWVGVKLFTGHAEQHAGKEANSVWEAVKIIVIADISMGVDNMLAVGGASHGNIGLLLFGLAFSIPFLLLTSDILSRVMERYPVIIYIGAAILGKVGGQMIMTDPTVTKVLNPSQPLIWAVEALLALGLVAIGYRQRRLATAAPSPAAAPARPDVAA
jgi:YjbE family integral membrane protein